MQIRFHYMLLFVLILSGCASRKRSATITPIAKEVVAIPDSTKNQHEKFEAKIDTVKTVYTIGLVLPLQLENHFRNDTISDNAPLLIPEAIPALQFYEGALAAKDSLANIPLAVKFRIFDCSGDSMDNVKLINSIDVRKCDAVILMTSSSLNTAIIKAAAKNTIPFIILQNSNTQILESNPNIWLSTPSNTSQIRLAATYLFKTYPTSQFITVFREVRKENDLATLFSNIIDSLAGTINICIKVNYLKGTGWSSLQSKLSKQKRNVLIIPTSDESYLSSIITKLDDVKNDYTFLLAGLPTWENFEAIDPLKLQNYNTHFFNGLFIDSENGRNQKFRKAFVDTYHTDALDQAFEGFDLVSYLVTNFNANQKKYNHYISIPNFESPQIGYDFLEMGTGSGKENQSISILKYGDYKLIKVK